MISSRISNRILICSVAPFLATVIAVAQNQPGGGQQSMPSQQPMSSQPMTPGAGAPGMDSGMANQQAMIDQTFVRKALEGGASEVQLGQLAQQKSQSDDVKQFGQKMVEDHTQLGDQMKPVAQQLGVKEPKGPSKKDKELVAKLEALSGPQFDEAYIQTMLKDHKQDLKDFKDEAQMAQNPNVKQVAQQGAGVISQHLQMIQQVAQAHNISPDGKKSASGGQ